MVLHMYRSRTTKTRTEIDLMCTEVVMYRNCPPLCTETVTYRTRPNRGQVVLSPLYDVKGVGGRTVQHGVAVVKPGCHDAARNCLGQVVRQQTAHVM